jgi:hypothetical protein
VNKSAQYRRTQLAPLLGSARQNSKAEVSVNDTTIRTITTVMPVTGALTLRAVRRRHMAPESTGPTNHAGPSEAARNLFRRVPPRAGTSGFILNHRGAKRE